MDPSIARLFTANAQWSKAVNKAEPDFFAKSAEGQSPKVLWIGCADSRVPESVLTASRPGDIFVHRNIANQFPLEDDNALSVLTYAVDHLGVEHVVVVGHTSCGGAAACYQASLDPDSAHSEPTTALGRWLAPLTALAISLGLADVPNKADALAALVEANVKAQVKNVCATAPIVEAWAKGRVWVHGWVYDLNSGSLKDLGVSRGPSA
ncbi:carbonic anhydrase [Amylostereum chailletii]|nr:carbonic anhydrase [Amylostereum chailletii]